MALRAYQQKAIDAVITDFDKGIRAMLINASTGTGKTVIASALPDALKSRLPGRMLFLAHREELVDQAVDKIRKYNPSLKVDKEMAEHCADVNADVVVAGVATLGRKNTKRIERFDWEKWDKLIVDEAHHSTAESYKNVFEAFGLSAKKLLLGITATPQRSDGKALAQIYEKISFVYSIRQAIEEGWLVDIRGFRISTTTSLSEVHKTAGDFSQDELSETVNTPVRNALVVSKWKELGENRTTIVFAVDIKHAQDLAAEFERQGVVAAAVWGNDPSRAEKIKMLKDGSLKVICNCAVLTEGFDHDRIGCIILARPTMSAVLHCQEVGRGTRLEEGTGNLKEWIARKPYRDQVEDFREIKRDLIVLDVVDNASKHSLITLPMLMGLQGVFDLKGRSLLKTVKDMEEAQNQNPNVDFSKLESLDGLKQYIEAVDMFNVRFPAEVEQNSDLTWYRAAGGGFRMLVPKEKDGKTGDVRITQNMLDQWEVFGTINGAHFHGVRSSIEDIFKVADEQIRERTNRITLAKVKREATWRKELVSPEQMTLLKRLYPYKQFPPDLSKGAASNLISERLASKNCDTNHIAYQLRRKK